MGKDVALDMLAGDLAHVVGGSFRARIIFYAEAVQAHHERQACHLFPFVDVFPRGLAFAQVQYAFMSGKGGGERSGEYHAETEVKDEKRKVFSTFYGVRKVRPK